MAKRVWIAANEGFRRWFINYLLGFHKSWKEEHFHGWMQTFLTIGACTSHESGGSQKYSKVLLRQQHFKAICTLIFLFIPFTGGVLFSFLTFFDPFTLIWTNGYFLLHRVHYAPFPTGLYSFGPRSMVCNSINFKLVSLNVRGMRSFEKRKALFNWLHKSQADICFLQETYSTPEVVNIWKKQWKGEKK